MEIDLNIKNIYSQAAEHFRRKGAKVLTALACTAVVIGYRSYEIVPAQSYGVRVTFGQMKSDKLDPGFYKKWPLYDTIHVFSNNTIIMEAEIGATDSTNKEQNTSDRNPISADVRTHYKINPDVGLIALKLPDLRGDNGKKILTELENQSFNAVVGSRPASETLDDPPGFLKAFLENLKWRLGQNNMPIQVDTAELLSFEAEIKKTIQFRIKSDGRVEQMAGPAAIPVTHGGKQAETVSPIIDPTRPSGGAATRSLAPNTSTVPVQP